MRETGPEGHYTDSMQWLPGKTHLLGLHCHRSSIVIWRRSWQIGSHLHCTFSSTAQPSFGSRAFRVSDPKIWNSPHMRFRLVPKLSTLDDLERPIRTLLLKSEKMRLLETTTKCSTPGAKLSFLGPISPKNLITTYKFACKISKKNFGVARAPYFSFCRLPGCTCYR